MSQTINDKKDESLARDLGVVAYCPDGRCDGQKFYDGLEEKDSEYRPIKPAASPPVAPCHVISLESAFSLQ